MMEISNFFDLGNLKNPNVIRLAAIAIIVGLLCDLLLKKVNKYLAFRRKIDALPGPRVANSLLGNIPASVFSLINTSANKLAADEFYTSQIQSVLGHTLIYRDEPLFRLWLGQEPVVCVWKPEMVELVLSDSFLLEKSYHYDFLRPWLGNGLLTSPGQIWRPRRKLLVPSFHFNILQAFVPVFDRKSKHLIRNLKQKLSEQCEQCEQQQQAMASNARDDDDETNRSIDGVEPLLRRDKFKSTVLDITPVITACTLDAICETIMGVSINAQENPKNDYCQSIYIVGETFLERIIQPRYWLDWIFARTELGKLYAYHLDKLHSFTRRVIREKKLDKLNSTIHSVDSKKVDSRAAAAAAGDNRERVSFSKVIQNNKHEPNERARSSLVDNLRPLKQTSVDQYEAKRKEEPKLPKAFLDLLLDKINLTQENEQINSKQQQQQKCKLNDEEIREEVDTFMFEGHDTTAMALSWTLFLLGHNLHVQEKLWREVDELFASQLISDTNEDDQLELDHLKGLKYLDCVIKEALRLCPSVPFIGRQTTSELKLGNHLVPPGAVVFVLIYQLHRNADIFPKPEQFDPDRFLPENVLGRHPFAYVPFSAGPRNCIGQKFAMAEMKTILLHLTRNFQFESVTPLDKARVQMEMVLRPKCPLNIRVKPRNHDSSLSVKNSLL